ncbi:MAG: TetR/AcrR family transcriptional regulator [Alphaproteobacteria bacterium]|nr:TetR/AcrR family transcriptional regulator [Alphaproteobacteria bacterium]MBU1513286.1 TetR/AcrR family transcriptional regulator [Alphaproteobacteria bacterium]MBU2093594.1 TetR/AcrR family transcriptional regulator [Alphaproteobacteria bacterium]MBU2151962.1 TetR/AcrR family transcriptional regulator [Alphaproteobacteria bacterium]MBU2307622.1 TetR/AcrR family transcriptional regulator [Alphaproteobacteria bacterium]
MRKGEATRVRIVGEAARQAALRGLTGVSLSDLADAVGLSKSGLFKHFDSKDDIHLAVVESVMDRFGEMIWKPAEILPPGRARLEVIFERWLYWCEEEWAESGCPINAFSIELDDQPGPLRDLLRRRLLGWRKTLLREFRALRDPALSEAEAQAAYFQMKSFILGHTDSRRMMGDDDARKSASAAFDALLDRTSRLDA